MLRVGRDCPYYNSGYQTAVYNQMGITGPGNEFYTKTGKFRKIIFSISQTVLEDEGLCIFDYYFCLSIEKKPWFVGRFKKDSEIFTIAYDEVNDRYTLAYSDKVCSLYATEEQESLKIDQTCSIYVVGKSKVQFNHTGMTYNGQMYVRQ